jgi:hypothetical protein
LTALNGVNSGIALLKSTGAYADVTSGLAADNTVVIFGNGGGAPFGGIFANTGSTGFALGSLSGSPTIGVAVDFTHGLIWFRIAPSGNWNGSGTADPATNTGGITISGAIGGGASAGPVVGFAWKLFGGGHIQFRGVAVLRRGAVRLHVRMAGLIIEKEDDNG